MTGRCLIINEWIFHDLLGENGLDAQSESVEFLAKLISGPDKIAVLEGSAWTNKANLLMTSNDPAISRLSKLLRNSLLLDPNNCRLVNHTEISPLPAEFNQIDLKEDLYLFETFFAVAADLIVTSDERLCDKVKGIESVKLVLRNEFLKDYLS